MSAVVIEDLGRRFPGQWAVRHLSMRIEAGQIMGFIGPNGAGKSTTMRILSTLDLPTEGRCAVAGYDCVEDADRVRRMVGFMPDSYGAYPNMTVSEYLDFFARSYGLRGAKRKQTVGDIIDFCQMVKMADKLVTTLSKGMKQRLCLGRCLINDPQVMILDEPTAGLDPRARIEFRDLLRILTQQKRAVLISSHILSELEEICDGVAIIEHGRLVAQGSVAAVKAQARAGLATQVQDPDHAIRLEIRLHGAFAGMAGLLAEQPLVAAVRDEGHGCWTCTIPADPEQRQLLLQRLIQAGAPVFHCAAQDENLEHAFMHLTKGVVS